MLLFLYRLCSDVVKFCALEKKSGAGDSHREVQGTTISLREEAGISNIK